MRRSYDPEISQDFDLFLSLHLSAGRLPGGNPKSFRIYFDRFNLIIRRYKYAILIIPHDLSFFDYWYYYSELRIISIRHGESKSFKIYKYVIFIYGNLYDSPKRRANPSRKIKKIEKIVFGEVAR